MPPARTSRGGSNFEGKRKPGSALDHEQGEQAEPNEADVTIDGAAGHMAQP
jgi:hypothetical protein